MGAEIEILRAEARRIVAAGLGAAAAGPATARALLAEPPALPGEGGRRLVLAAGRFARDMAVAARDALGPCETLIVTEAASARPLEGARVFGAGWPEPDAVGLAASAAVAGTLARLMPDDAALLLLSAGAARMLPAPAAGIALGDLGAVEAAMLAAGAAADEALLVRQQLSRFEGGGLAACLPPGACTALALAGAASAADPRRFAGGMLAPPLGSRVTARALLELYGLWDRVPPRVRDCLSGRGPAAAQRGPAPLAAPPMPRPVPARPSRLRLRFAASNALALAAMAAAGPRAVARPLQGGAVEIAHDLLGLAAGLEPGTGSAFGLEPALPGARLSVGLDRDPDIGTHSAGEDREPEPAGAALTLRAPVVAGAAGPRHADLALRFALLARARRLAGPWVLLLTASDGGGAAAGPAAAGPAAAGPATAGPATAEDAVGKAAAGRRAGHAPGVTVDSGTLAALAAAGIDAEAAAGQGRAAMALEAIGAAFRSGPTGTDVGDIGVFLRGR